MWLMLLHIFSKYCLSAAAHSAAANSVNVRRAVAVITADAVNSKKQSRWATRWREVRYRTVTTVLSQYEGVTDGRTDAGCAYVAL